jgi:hypothetical protein
MTDGVEDGGRGPISFAASCKGKGVKIVIATQGLRSQEGGHPQRRIETIT